MNVDYSSKKSGDFHHLDDIHNLLRPKRTKVGTKVIVNVMLEVRCCEDLNIAILVSDAASVIDTPSQYRTSRMLEGPPRQKLIRNKACRTKEDFASKRLLNPMAVMAISSQYVAEMKSMACNNRDETLWFKRLDATSALETTGKHG
ncbi:hypothetical protein SLS58_001228 [Diplodia intermedia]|uniref:Uncharacterized protein n=1 Tax=Diplodia intermedia TaxID=856260 RepID=A0ABR3U3K6_9PEZI